MTALIVDDEEDIGLMVSAFLKKEGIIPTALNRIKPATELIQKRGFDYFFLDLNLPDGTGFDLLPLINEKYPESKVIIISAYDGHLETSKAEEFGVAAFLKKPFTKKHILEAVDL